MTKKSRYFLLAGGFAAFLILAPLIVLYVRGVSYDFKTGNFVTTGILAVSAQPSNAAVSLNGKTTRSSPGDIKFLVPGQYQITLSAPAYNNWTKRLPITAGQVTWASPSYNKIYLFFSNPPTKQLADGVLDFATQGDSLAYLTADDFTVSSISHPASSQSFILPKTVTKILATDSSFKNFVLAGQATGSLPTILFFSPDSGFLDLSGLFDTIPKMQFSNSRLYALSGNVLSEMIVSQKTLAPVFQGVQAFYFLNDSLYFMQQGTSTEASSLIVSQAPFSDTQPLLNSLPNFGQADLRVSFEKKIFLVADDSLYLANASMQQLAQNVSAWSFDPQSSTLAVLDSGELDYYDSQNGGLDFVTRSSQNLADLNVNAFVGYAFFSDGKNIEAIELDTRDTQNQYTLYSGENLQKFTVNGAGQTILVLDNGQLKTLTIR